MKVLITGINGFVGSHLAELFLQEQAEVHGTIRPRSEVANISKILDRIYLHEVDIRDPHSCYEVMKKVKPDLIFHLAALSFVPVSWTNTNEVMMVNVMGTLNILQAVKEFVPTSRILVAGSSEEYGKVLETEVPISESNALRPLSPYGVSKVAADKLALQFFHAYGLHVVVTRAFNHTGPRRPDKFVVSSFCKQVVDKESMEGQQLIEVGNLDAIRDFTDVRDMVVAYKLALDLCEPGECYNISSGGGWSIHEVLSTIFLMSHKKNNFQMVIDKNRLRPSDVPRLIGDSTKFRKCTGWHPLIPFSKTIIDILDYWRKRK